MVMELKFGPLLQCNGVFFPSMKTVLWEDYLQEQMNVVEENRKSTNFYHIPPFTNVSFG